MRKFFHTLLFIALISHAVSLSNSASSVANVSRVEKYAALGSGKSIMLTKDELSDLLGQQKTDKIFQMAQDQVKQHKNDRFWTAIKAGFIIGAVVTVPLICKML